MSGTSFMTQRHFRFHSDTNQATATTNATWEGAEDTAITWPSNTNLRLRINIDNTGTANNSNVQKMQYSLNGGSYLSQTDPLCGISTAALDMTADPSQTTMSTKSMLTTAAGTQSTGQYTETGIAAQTFISSVQWCEYDFAFKIASTVADGATIDFRMYSNAGAAFDSYAVTPRITVGATAQGTFFLGTKVL